MVVATMYQLARLANGYSDEHKKLVRKNMVITREYAEGMTRDYKNSGKWFDIDEEATSLYKQGKWKDGEAIQDAVVVEETTEEKPKEKRKRRTKEQIEADKK